MMLLSTFILLISGLLSTNGKLVKLTPCRWQDLNCFKTMFSDFLEQTYNGALAYNNVIPMDPFSMPSLKMKSPRDTILHFENVTITGLKDEKLQEFNLNQKEKTALFLAKTVPKITGVLTVEFTKFSKSLTGTITMKGKAVINAEIDYNLETDENSIKHIIYGPDLRVACEPSGELELTMSSGLLETAKEDMNLYEQEVRNSFCKMVEKPWSAVMHNIRQVARIMPMSEIIEQN